MCTQDYTLLRETKEMIFDQPSRVALPLLQQLKCYKHTVVYTIITGTDTHTNTLRSSESQYVNPFKIR